MEAVTPHPYQNPDVRCTHPPATYIDYCWSYAHYVNTHSTKRATLLVVCRGCEFWKEQTGGSAETMFPKVDKPKTKVKHISTLFKPATYPNES